MPYALVPTSWPFRIEPVLIDAWLVTVTAPPAPPELPEPPMATWAETELAPIEPEKLVELPPLPPPPPIDWARIPVA